jgi:hypothetical protein
VTYRTRSAGDSGSFVAGSFDDGADDDSDFEHRASFRSHAADAGTSGISVKKRRVSGNARKGSRNWGASTSTATQPSTPVTPTVSAPAAGKPMPSLSLSDGQWSQAAVPSHRDFRDHDNNEEDGDDDDEEEDEEYGGDGVGNRRSAMKRRRAATRPLVPSGTPATTMPVTARANSAATPLFAGGGTAADERKGEQRHRLRSALGLLSSKLRARLLIGYLGLTKRPFHTRPRVELLQIHNFLVTHFPKEIASRGQIAPEAMEAALTAVGAGQGTDRPCALPT